MKANYRAWREAQRTSRVRHPECRRRPSRRSRHRSERNATVPGRLGEGRSGRRSIGSYVDILVDPAANETAAEFVRAKIRAIVHDPEVAETLSPRTFPVGTKRPCLDTGYYETFNRPNVHLVDLRKTPLVEFTETGLRTSAAEYEFDAIVFATGFDAMTGALTAIDIRNGNGASLASQWTAGPRTYLGVAMAGFPNLFTITGPGSPSVLSNMVVSIEQHVEWISDCIAYLREHGYAAIEATEEAEAEWVQHVADVGVVHAVPEGRLLVHGRERAGQAAGVPALHRRRRRVPGEVRRGRGERLRGLHPFETGRARDGMTPVTPMPAGPTRRARRSPGWRWRQATARCGRAGRARRLQHEVVLEAAVAPHRLGADAGFRSEQIGQLQVGQVGAHVGQVTALGQRAADLGDPAAPVLAGELPGARPARHPGHVAQADVRPAVALEREREHRVRPDVHGVVDVPGQVHAEERVARVGYRVDHAADAVSDLRRAARSTHRGTGRSADRRTEPRLCGEAVAVQTGAHDQVVEVEDAAGRLHPHAGRGLATPVTGVPSRTLPPAALTVLASSSHIPT